MIPADCRDGPDGEPGDDQGDDAEDDAFLEALASHLAMVSLDILPAVL